MSIPLKSSGTGPIATTTNQASLRLHDRVEARLNERLWQYLWGNTMIQTRVLMRVIGRA